MYSVWHALISDAQYPLGHRIGVSPVQSNVAQSPTVYQ